MPVVLPLGDGLEIDYALVNTSSLQGLSGTHYSDNHFGGSTSPIVYTGTASSMTRDALTCSLAHHIP